MKRYADAAWQQEASARVDHAYTMHAHVLPDQIHNFAHNNDWLAKNLCNIGRVHDAIDLASPLGQTLARLEGDSSGVRVMLQDGRTEQAASWRELTERAFGVTIPVDGLASWVRAVPHSGAPYTVERDAQARVSLLRQDGWEIVYAYADDAARRPARVVLSLPGAEAVDVRVVVDRWE